MSIIDSEHFMNYVPVVFSIRNGSEEGTMVRAVVEEAAALASIGLFLATVAVWAQVLGVI